MMYVHCVGTAFDCCTVRLCHVGSFSTLLANRYIELNCSAFAYASHDLLGFVPRDRCLVDEDIIAGTVAID